VPRWQHVLSLELERGAWTAALSQRYRHGYQDLNPLPDGSFRRVGAYDVWDARIGCRVSPTLKLTLGVQNLFDRDPPFTNGNDFFQRGYNPSYADPRGRLWTAALSATLRR
jgi:iron complex outermembrane receptor protein